MLTDTSKSPYAVATPLEWDKVTLKEGFWRDIVQNTANNTVPHLQAMFEDKEISHVLENFRICAGETMGEHEGTVFGDGDFYKWMEAALYATALTEDKQLSRQLVAYCNLIAKAQLDDGYISTKQIIDEKAGNKKVRMGDVNDFEIYNMGHLFTTACLYLRVTKSDALMKVAVKAAKYLEKLYDEAQRQGEVKTAVCPSHYMGLIEMYRTTGEAWYLRLAKLAIELRDLVEEGTDDNQDKIPLKQHETIVGHAVRANYLYAGVADLYAETGDEAYLSMLQKVWHNLVTKKIYITGGCGALYNGVSPYGNFFKDQKTHQAYGYEYQLPNITAYNETCASVGLVLWAYRMFQIELKSEYIDWLERTMLNVNLAAVSIDGKKYFYENMLRRTKELPYELVWPLHRTDYIYSYCCPPNIARTLAEVAEYFYLTANSTIWCAMYGANEAVFELENGAAFTLLQETNYPYDGKINLTVKEVVSGEGLMFDLKIRVPSWAVTGHVKTLKGIYELSEKEETGYLTVRAKVRAGERISVDFDMPIRYTRAHPFVEETFNQVAVERGPLVYCVETPDVKVSTIDDVVLILDEVLLPSVMSIAGRQVTVLEGAANIIKRDNYDEEALYQTVNVQKEEKIQLRLVPYFAWDNRGIGEMKIWMPYKN